MIADLPPRALQLLTARQTKPARFATLRPATTNIGTVGELDQLSRARVLKYTSKVGFGLADGRKTAAYRLAAFYLGDVGLTEPLAAHCLEHWNALNAPPLPEGVLSSILRNAGKYARGAA